MFSIKEFMAVLERFAPLSLSYKMIEKGHYDNSGVIVNNSDCVNKVLFTLELSCDAVEKAVREGCDTIVTHHPAIYHPIKCLDQNQTGALLMAIRQGINVISMHLNLDIAKGGIDHNLSVALGGKNARIIDYVTENEGYGREFSVQTDARNFVQSIKQALSTDKVIYYGNAPVKKVASFCGGGSDSALEYVCNKEDSADTIVTSDVAHHVLKEIVEKGKNVVIIPHYASEQFGFNEFYKIVKKEVNEKIETFYFIDKRFM